MAVVNRRPILAVVLVLALIAVGFSAIPASGSHTVDRGRAEHELPSWLVGDVETETWKLEWVVCGSDTMKGLARDPDVQLSVRALARWQAVSPQYAADRLASFLELNPASGGYRGRWARVAIDGCRNGILFRYYHPALYD